PKYRGQGPNVWPIANGDAETGQTIHWLDEGIDTGDIIAQKAMPLLPTDTGATLGEKLERLGAELFIETWPLIASGTAPRIKQDDSQATYSVAPKRKHARIDWSKSAEEIGNLCRAFTSGKGAWARIGGKRLYVWEAEPYRGEPALEGDTPGQATGVTGKGVVVQTGGGSLLLVRTEVTQGGTDLLTALGGGLGSVPIILG
ncbi:MAG: formyltransferase family protein, partial [Candidatus Latescibacteria bacterium]|nr:formyltransferase family protein [Candidatus Latescibacterota bacterium]